MKPEWIPVIDGDHDSSMFDPKTLKMVRFLVHCGTTPPPTPPRLPPMPSRTSLLRLAAHLLR
jgi:hypothetical protein